MEYVLTTEQAALQPALTSRTVILRNHREADVLRALRRAKCEDISLKEQDQTGKPKKHLLSWQF